MLIQRCVRFNTVGLLTERTTISMTEDCLLVRTMIDQARQSHIPGVKLADLFQIFEDFDSHLCRPSLQLTVESTCEIQYQPCMYFVH
jgi:hypothetical protein